MTQAAENEVLPLSYPLYTAIMGGNVYNVPPARYTVDSRFSSGLYLNKQLNT